MTFRLRHVWLALALLAATAASARSEEAAGAAAPPASVVDVGDLWRAVRHKDASDASISAQSRKAFFAMTPSIGAKPSTGLSAGFSGNIAFFLGDPATTRISSLTGGFKLSQLGQTLGGFKFSTFAPEDGWYAQGDLRLNWTSQHVYGLGTATPSSSGDSAKYTYKRLYETVYRTIRPGLFVGGGVNFSDHGDVRPGDGAAAAWDRSAYSAYTARHGFPADGQTSGGVTAGVLYDTRDNGINASRGSLASASYRTFFDGFLGGDSTWQELALDARTYRNLSQDGRRKLALWFMGDFVTAGAAPYFDLPATAANDRSARGYREGRYRGEQLVYGEMEYRSALTRSGLLGFVTFLNLTTVDSQETGERLFSSVAPGAGLGLRVLLNKRSRTNLCSDYAWGKDGSRGFYLAIQEAF